MTDLRSVYNTLFFFLINEYCLSSKLVLYSKYSTSLPIVLSPTTKINNCTSEEHTLNTSCKEFPQIKLLPAPLNTIP